MTQPIVVKVIILFMIIDGFHSYGNNQHFKRKSILKRLLIGCQRSQGSDFCVLFAWFPPTELMVSILFALSQKHYDSFLHNCVFGNLVQKEAKHVFSATSKTFYLDDTKSRKV